MTPSARPARAVEGVGSAYGRWLHGGTSSTFRRVSRSVQVSSPMLAARLPSAGSGEFSASGFAIHPLSAA